MGHPDEADKRKFRQAQSTMVLAHPQVYNSWVPFGYNPEDYILGCRRPLFFLALDRRNSGKGRLSHDETRRSKNVL